MAEDHHVATERHNPELTIGISAEYLAGKRFDYQEDIAASADVDLMASTPGQDLNWLEDIKLLAEDGVPAVFDRYSNSFIKIYFPIPAGQEDEVARKTKVSRFSVDALDVESSALLRFLPNHVLSPRSLGLRRRDARARI